MHKRFLYGKLIAAHIAAFAVMVFVSSNFLFNESTITNANASVNPVFVSPIVNRARVTRARLALPTVAPTRTPTSRPTTIPTKAPTSIPTLAPTSAPAASAVSNLSGLESQTVTLINDERKRQGLGELGVDGALTTAARRHAKDMCDHNNFSHTGTDGSNFTTRSKDAGYGGFAVGEVIGWNHTSAESIFNGWMGSPPHKEILMKGDISKIGVGWSGNCVVGVVGN